ncbi:MAG: amino-acid N-acetyltransferase [Betaproteobacteria bacterium]|nr:amino-acid N-acetyltransferase [Betaproteobacteria bacterium]
MASSSIVRALRDAAPYLQTHRARTFVVQIGATLARQARLGALLADLLILRHICSIRLAIVFEIACEPGPVDKKMLAGIGSRAARIRDRIEQLLAAGAPGKIPGATAAGGNLLTARRIGTIDGVDMHERGCNPKADATSARGLLDAGAVAVLPAIGFAADGSRLLVPAIDATLAIAAATEADKIIVLTSQETIDALGFRDLTGEQVKKRISEQQDAAATRELLSAAVQAIESGVDRVHLIGEQTDGGVLLELLSPDGVAAMVSRDRFDSIRPAKLDDVPAIAELLAPGIESGAVAERSIEEIAASIDRFVVLAHDSAIVACAALELLPDNRAELRSLAVRPDSMNQDRGELLLRYCERKAQEEGVRRLLAVSTQARDWLIGRGFADADASELPPERRRATDSPRNATVLAKNLKN